MKPHFMRFRAYNSKRCIEYQPEGLKGLKMAYSAKKRYFINQQQLLMNYLHAHGVSFEELATAEWSQVNGQSYQTRKGKRIKIDDPGLRHALFKAKFCDKDRELGNFLFIQNVNSPVPLTPAEIWRLCGSPVDQKKRKWFNLPVPKIHIEFTRGEETKFANLP